MLLVDDAHAATWRDDSLYIAHVARPDGNTDIYTTNITRSGTVRLTDDPANDVAPDWGG